MKARSGTGWTTARPCWRALVRTFWFGFAALLCGLGHSASSPSLGEKRLVIYRVDFPDFAGAAITPEAAAALVAELDGYYRAMSYERMTFAAVGQGSAVTETLRLPQPAAHYDNAFVRLLEDTRAAAAQAGYGLGEFDFDVVCTGSKPFLVYGALAYVGGPGLWLGNNNFNVGVLGHELGHNLGLPHASGWVTGGQSISGPGLMAEFGDPFDSLGLPGGSASHFNTRFKQLLGWIDEADTPLVRSNGTYRLHAHDRVQARGPRALRLAREDGRECWLEFRQAFDNRWVTNGLCARLAGAAAENTLLLDLTPGTPSGFQDAALLVGRTFFERCGQWYVTPVGKDATSPEALEVVVNRGPFPGNRPPTLAVGANATAIAVGGTTRFEAQALDPDGDPLAYFWDYGDGTWGENQAVAQRAWTRAGEFVVQCTVTDMRGGAASSSVVVRVGDSAFFSVSGHAWHRGRPLGGALIQIGGRTGYSDSDGTYRIGNVRPGTYSPAAVLDGLTLYATGFVNPITAGPNAAAVDFVALEPSLNAYTLIPAGTVWRYWESVTPPGAGWTAPGFEDSSWPAGPAKLGFGIGGEQTRLSAAATNQASAVYFRAAFAAPDPGAIDYLAFRLRRDDGAVVYLNGREIYRENLGPGEVGPETRALAEIVASDEAVFHRRLVPAAGWLREMNVLAVELHHADGARLDLGFDLELAGMTEASDRLVPALTIARESDQVLLSWPAAYPHWQPEQRDTLGPGAYWRALPHPGEPVGGFWQIGESVTGPAGFYRLRQLGPCDGPGMD